MRKIKLKLTQYEANTLKYFLERAFLIPMSGSQVSACKRIRKKLEREL